MQINGLTNDHIRRTSGGYVTRARHPAWGSGDHGFICACVRAASYEGTGTGSETVIAAGRNERESVQCMGV